MLNLNGEIIKGEIEGFIEKNFVLMDKLPSHYKEKLEDKVSIQHRLIQIQNDLFTRLGDLLNLYISQWQYGESKEENYILASFIKYAELAIQKNRETLDRLLNGKEFTLAPLDKMFREDVILGLVNLATKDNKIQLQNFLLSDPYYSSVYNNQLDKYNNFNSNFLNSVMTFAEATEKWGLGESTLRSMVNSNRLKEGLDYRKSGKVWLIKKDAMVKLYGEPRQ